MRAVVMRCDACDVEVRAKFNQSHFQSLSADDQAFLEEYLLADFSIKALAERSGLGYAAIRTRLDRIIGTYRNLYDNEAAKRAVLEQLERGEITAEKAAEIISGL
jgi:hypothetical protein